MNKELPQPAVASLELAAGTVGLHAFHQGADPVVPAEPLVQRNLAQELHLASYQAQVVVDNQIRAEKNFLGQIGKNDHEITPWSKTSVK